MTAAWEGAEGAKERIGEEEAWEGKEKKQEGQAQMLLQHSAALSFPPSQHLMISDIFINTAEVEEEEKKSRGAKKGMGEQRIMQARMDSWGG